MTRAGPAALWPPITGSGSGENFRGILNVSGVQAQAFATDIPTTVRKAITKVRVTGKSAVTGILMNPSDVETVDLMKESGTGRFMEIVAEVLKVPLAEIGPLSLQSTKVLPFSTTCAAFGRGAAVTMQKEGERKEDILAGLHEAQSGFDYLLTVPCDSPLFPLDLLERMVVALQAHSADIALAAAPETQPDGSKALRDQPVFCLLKTHLCDDLRAYLEGGGRKIDTWLHTHRCVRVAFDASHDDPLAFANANTLGELHALEKP